MQDKHWISRTTALIGEEKLNKLINSHVLVVGLGGIGSFAAEFIARAGTFTQSGSTPLNKVAKWNGTAWSDAGNGMMMSNGVLALAINAQYFFAGGSTWIGDPLNFNNLARWHGSQRGPGM